MLTEISLFFIFMSAGFLQTVTGFGYAIIAAPLLALVLGIKETVILTMITGYIAMLFLLRAIKNEGSYSAVGFLVLASFLGAIPGAYVMSTISNDWLKLFIGLLLLLVSAALWFNYNLPLSKSKLADGIIGLVSGFLATTTSINGPPLVLYFLNAKLAENKTIFRANLTRYFLLTDPHCYCNLVFRRIIKYTRTLVSYL